MTWHKFKDGKVAIDLSKVTHLELCECYHGTQFEDENGELCEEKIPYWTVDICFASGRFPQQFPTEEEAQRFFDYLFRLMLHGSVP